MRATENIAQGLPAETGDLLYPGRRYDRPADVLADPALTIAERRAILSEWASDACAVASAPPLRRAPFSTATVTFDEIMDALLEVDRMERAPRPKREVGAVRSNSRIAPQQVRAVQRRLHSFAVPGRQHGRCIGH